VKTPSENQIIFDDWEAERRRLDDWELYFRGSRLNKSLVAAETGMNRSTFRAGNGAISERFSAVEDDLIKAGRLVPSIENTRVPNLRENDSHEDKPDPRDRKIETLEKTVALQKVEISNLRSRLRQHDMVLGDLASRGLRLHPGFLGTPNEEDD